jgi:hypothetical protein
MDGPVSREEFAMLRDQVNAVDAGTRGMGAVAVQLTEVIKDVSDVRLELRQDVRELRDDLAGHRREHETEERARVAGRRWMIATVVAALVAIEAPLGYVITHLH